MDQNKALGVAGKHVRRGRPPKYLSYTFDQSADAVFCEAGRLIDEARTKDFDTRLKVMVSFLPLALKRIPDKQEIVQLTLSASVDPAVANALLNLANRNLLIYKDLEHAELSEEKTDSGGTTPPELR